MFEKASMRLWLLAALTLATMLALGGAGVYGLRYLNGGLGSALQSNLLGAKWRFWLPSSMPN